jgi:hypothetical protein
MATRQRQNLGAPTTITDLAKKIQARFWDTGVPAPVLLWADRQMERIQADLDLVRRGDDGYADFLATHVSREHERYTYDGDPANAPYETLRDAPLCTCRDYGCPLKEGRLPRELREADDLQTAIREYTLDHEGDPVVLDNESDDAPGARQAWSDKRARVFSVLRTVELFTAPDRPGDLEPPTAEDLADNPHVTPAESAGDEDADADREAPTPDQP